MSDVRPSLYALADLIADKCKHSQCYDDDGHTDGCGDDDDRTTDLDVDDGEWGVEDN